MRDDTLELIPDFAQPVHRRDDLVAEVLGVLLGAAVGLVLEERLERVDAAFRVIGQPDDLVEAAPVSLAVAPAALTAATASPSWAW